MTLDETFEVYRISEKLKQAQLDLRKLQEERTYISGIHYTGMPKGNISDNDDWIDYLDRERECQARINALEKQLQDARTNVIRFVYSTKDPILQDVITYRCASLMSWDEIDATIPLERGMAKKLFWNYWETH